MRRRRYGIGFVVLATLLAGCVGREEAVSPASPPSATAGPVTWDATGLIGSWTVTGPGVPADTALRLAADGLRVFRECDVLSGDWRADSSGLFLAIAFGHTPRGNEGCATGPPTEPPGRLAPGWLARANGFRDEGAERVLLDDQGAEVVRLRPGARPDGGPNLHSSLVEPPAVTDEARRRLAPAAPLPAALTPPVSETLVARWLPATGPASRPEPAYVTLAADGTWHGSDGCNGAGGRWAAGPDGALVAIGGPSTLIGCDNVPVGDWLAQARRVGLDGDVLVLLDAQGAETGRLHHG